MPLKGDKKMKSTDTGITRILKAFTYSYEGFKAAYVSEAAFRQDIAFCIICSILLFFFPSSTSEKIYLASVLLLILIAELINTAIETLVDRISPEYNKLSKKAKDIGSLIVLLAFVYAIMQWWSVFLYYIKLFL